MRHAIATLGLAATLALTSLPALAFGPERYDADRIEVRNLLGNIEIKVEEGADGITVRADGKDRRLMDLLHVSVSGDAVVIDMDLDQKEERGWRVDDEDVPQVELVVPPGTDLRVHDLIGAIDARGALDAVRIDLTSVASIELQDVGSLAVDADGALSLQVGNVAEGADLTVHGAGSIELGDVTGETRIDVHGMSSVEVSRVDGPLSLSLSGVGSIDVQDGRSETLDVALSGLGSISYDGVAETRSVAKSGLGSISIRDNR